METNYVIIIITCWETGPSKWEEHLNWLMANLAKVEKSTTSIANSVEAD